MTIGLCAKRVSCVASGTISTLGWCSACAQNEVSRGVSAASKPILDLNHCRRSSTSEIRAIGVPQIVAARDARSSSIASGGVSSTR